MHVGLITTTIIIILWRAYDAVTTIIIIIIIIISDGGGVTLRPAPSVQGCARVCSPPRSRYRAR